MTEISINLLTLFSKKAGAFRRRMLAMAIAVVIILFAVQPSRPKAYAAFPATNGPQVAPEVGQTIAAEGAARVVITLAEPTAGQNGKGIAEQQDALLARIPSQGLELKRRYEALPALAGVLNREGLTALATDPEVAQVQLDLPSSGHLAQSVSALGADVVHADYELTGSGMRVAVLDTGIDTDHPDLAPAIVAQSCFTDGDCAPHGDDVGTVAEDEHGHGTNVSGIITADGQVSAPGFALDAGIVAIRVLNEANWGWLSDWVAGLDWILANQTTLQVDVVNMSLGTVALYEGNCDDDWPIVAHAVAELAQIGVPVFSSSGNQGAATAMGSPACNQEVIAVGATYDGNLGRQPAYGTFKTWFGGLWPECYDAVTSLHTITCFTNGGEMLDLLAPGMWITSTGMGGGLSTYAGTSQASPTAASIAALMLQADDDLTPLQLQTILSSSGTEVVDSRNGMPLSAINALAAVEALQPVAPLTVTISAPALLVPGVSYPFTAIVSPENAWPPLSYAWEATEHPPRTNSNGASDTILLNWPTVGSRQVQVTASNDAGEVAASLDVAVVDGSVVWLPIIGGAY